MRSILFLIFCLLGVGAIQAIDTGQQIFKPMVRTLTVTNPEDFMAPPVIRMGTNDRLNINFDIIGDQHEYLRYRLLHCNADWQPSRLLESEFIRGFNEAEIDDYAYSSNTYIHYVNYNISLPDPNLPILTSGNYLLQVYPENQPDDLLLQARFAVSDEASFVKGGMTTRTDKGTDSDYQQLFFNVDLGGLGDINPYQDLYITVTQNNNPRDMRVVSHPLRVDRGNAVFEHSPELVFEAGNEFRRFETVRTDYPGMHVDSVKFHNGVWHAWLQPDFSRKDKEYAYDSTQHGRFKIDEYNSTDPDLSADYVVTHFTLDPGERQFGEIYVDGDFTNRTLSDQNIMRYDFTTGLYELAMPLKQGSYNYQYIVVPNTAQSMPENHYQAPGSRRSQRGSSAPIEGNKYETQNEYLVKVFVRKPGQRGDRLVAVTLL